MKKENHYKRPGILLLLIVSLILVSSAALNAEQEQNVAVLPFSIHSEEDLSYLSQAIPDMLSTRLEKRGEIKTVEKPLLAKTLQAMELKTIDGEQAVLLGEKLGVDYLVLGGLTKIGRTLSLDISLIETKKTKPVQRLYTTADNIEEITGKLQDIARKINFIILEKEIISKVLISGNRFIEEDAVLFAIRTKPGEEFSPQLLQEDLKRIYQMGYFKDIQITSEDTESGKKITFQVEEKPMVKAVQIQGNKKVKINDIEEVLEVKVRTILDLNKVTGDVTRIKKIYLDKGYFRADVSYKVKPMPDGMVGVDYSIKEGDIIKVKKVTFSGNDSISGKKISKVMETREKSFTSLFTTKGIYKDEGLEKDTERIMAYYYSKGFLLVEVEKPTVTFNKKGINVHINIIEGPKFTIGSIDFDGDLIYDKIILRSKIKAVSGKTFNGQKLNDDLVALRALYAEQGFAFADITPLTNINDEEKTVDLSFKIIKGKKIYIEEIKITGNTRTRDKVIRREMRLADGAVYNSEQVKRSKQQINNLGYFEKVNINTSPGSKDSLIKLHIEVTERPTGSFSVGAGYSSVDSVVGMFQISQNNLFGKGQSLKLMSQIGGDSSQFDISFTEPWFRGTRVSVGFDLFLIDRDYYDFERKSKGFNLRAGFPLDHKFDYTRLYLTYRLEDTDIDVDCRGIANDGSYDKDCGDVPLSILEQQGRTVTSSITTSIVRDSRNDRWSPRMGSNSKLSVELAGFGGDAKFIGLIASSAKYFPLPFDTAFMVRGEIGQLFEAGEDIPIAEKFFLGGLDSLRGFDSRSVAPMEKEIGDEDKPDDEAEWDPVGGEKELFFNFEFLFPIMPGSGVRGVVFYDIGNAYETNDDFFSDLRTDAGVGINWYSPFGPLRLVWAVNLDPDDKYDEDSSNFEFSMGQMF